MNNKMENNNKAVISELMTTYDISVMNPDKFLDLCELCENYVKYKNGELTLEEVKEQQDNKVKERNTSICRACKCVMDKDDEYYMTGICSRCHDRNSR